MPITIKVTLKQFDEFVARLAKHDWHYAYSDDSTVYRAGKAESDALQRIADINQVMQDAYDAYYEMANPTSYEREHQTYNDRLAARNKEIAELRARIEAMNQPDYQIAA